MEYAQEQTVGGGVKCIALLYLCAAALAASGCGLLEDEPRRLDVGMPKDQLGQNKDESQSKSGQSEQASGPVRKPVPDSVSAENLVFYAPEDAPRCPEITIGKWSGGTKKLRPVQEDRVVLVVMWNRSQPSGQAAAVHVNQLLRTYGNEGLRVLGLASVEQGNKKKLQSFIRRRGFLYVTWRLTRETLTTFAETAGIESGMPSFALVDKKGRLRLYQQGFSYALGGNLRRGARNQRVYENALYGRKVEDFVRKLLREGQPDSDLPQRMRQSGAQTKPSSQQNNRRQ